MLEKILDRISQGGAFSTHSLAQELGVSKELVEAMLANLARAGYLQPVESCGESGCGGCRTVAACKPRKKGWILVKKDLPE